MRNNLFRLISGLILMSLCSLILSNCAAQRKVIYPSISHHSVPVDLLKYRKVAVSPFSDAPNAKGFGEIVSGLVSQTLFKMGFTVVERIRPEDILEEQAFSMSGLSADTDYVKIGNLLGVNAIVEGMVGQYHMETRKSDTVYVPFMGTYIPIQGEYWNASFVSISLRIIEIETGKIIFSGSGQFPKPINNPLQEAAQYITEGILVRWVGGTGLAGFLSSIKSVHNKNYPCVIKVDPKLPAKKYGIKVDDVIIRINGKSTENLSEFEIVALLRGEEGEIICLDIMRDGKKLYFEIPRAGRPW